MESPKNCLIRCVEAKEGTPNIHLTAHLRLRTAMSERVYCEILGRLTDWDTAVQH